ncbi:hypothetical protein NY035_05130 [Corynebacterium diphtheriae bv. mitis]|nr:hypothetical protein [Corynebacterium diphtheriae]MDZ5309045.1 hypothetical protein [Corynebacterium diphtheriae]UWE84169.1 hypothetical protein NY053_01740 [Corynebacterium diphtheriae bv. mitis]UWE92369.1 hypothetical protein NY044_01745 [Corynebacterium diphtheriae bv. mitis]UWE96513.1 hypothetical protein NY039_00515 [Corynebacterium diphtheriae bv. mitis]UWE99560.1 hypothetical protein NY040_05130 [Corynebacterium diphtheriae bv. mitis]
MHDHTLIDAPWDYAYTGDPTSPNLPLERGDFHAANIRHTINAP